MSDELEVWLDCDLCPMQRLGTLAHDRGQVRFHYEKTWLAQRDMAFAIDPLLSLTVPHWKRFLPPHRSIA